MKSILTLLTLSFIACTDNSNSASPPFIAQYKDQKLSQTDLQRHLPNFINPADSARLANLYIKQWLTQQATLNHIANKINHKEPEINAKTAEYKNQLILQEYFTQLIDQELDTIISNDTIAHYYRQHQTAFTAPTHLYQFRYIISPQPEGRELQKQITSNDPQDLIALKGWCNAKNATYKLDSSWTEPPAIQQIQALTHINLQNIKPNDPPISFLVENNKDKMHHFFYLINLIKPNQILPLSYVSIRIRQSLLQKRKNELINRYQQNFYNQAMQNNEAIIY